MPEHDAAPYIDHSMWAPMLQKDTEDEARGQSRRLDRNRKTTLNFVS
jgi:hypothetical protein